MIESLERILFAHRGAVLGLFAALTLATGWFSLDVGVETSFEKHFPAGHPYIDTFLEYRDEMAGVNRVVLVLRSRQGDIWNPAFMRKLSEATDALFFLEGIDRRTVTSLWTPDVRYTEITEEGMRSEDMIGENVTVENISQADVDRIRDRVIRSGLVGQLVSNDFTAAMVTAAAVEMELQDQPQSSVLLLSRRLEREIRAQLSDDDYDVHLIGFVPMMGAISDSFWPGIPEASWRSVREATATIAAVLVTVVTSRSVVSFFLVALGLTAAAVYAYCRSWKLTLLPLACSFVSGVWQFGVMGWLGYGVDPLAILVPFLVFAIGVSHGMQQINLIARCIAAGDDSLAAARTSFRGLLVPGSMALITDLVAFVTLVLIPIPMVAELGITASIGVAFKILSNLILLPVLASYLRFDAGFVERTNRSQALATRIMRVVGRVAEPRQATAVLSLFGILLGAAVWQGVGRHVGDLHAGATELRPDSVYNRDASLIVDRFSLGLDLLTIVAETPEGSCVDYEVIRYLDDFSWHMSNVPDVMSVMSTPVVARVINAAWNEGNLAWREIPRNRYALMQVTSSIPSVLGVFNADCSLMPVQIYTADHRAQTIEEVVGGALAFIEANPSDRVELRLASGNIGIQAATNESLERSELPMLLLAYASIIVLVVVTYRSWRAVVCCCLPLTLATFLGYWFMKELEIGLKVATLPVMVLAVGIGVDYAFYIYSRLRHHALEGLDVTRAYQRALLETGNAVVFTGITLAIGVSTWAFSPLKFQADMGLLLAFMFTINMLMATTALPALAVVLDRLLPQAQGGGEKVDR
jgi:predicted RND superfamily exporter protein